MGCSDNESCKNAIHTLFSDDDAAATTRMVIEVTTDSGKVVAVSISFDHAGNAISGSTGSSYKRCCLKSFTTLTKPSNVKILITGVWLMLQDA